MQQDTVLKKLPLPPPGKIYVGILGLVQQKCSAQYRVLKKVPQPPHGKICVGIAALVQQKCSSLQFRNSCPHPPSSPQRERKGKESTFNPLIPKSD